VVLVGEDGPGWALEKASEPLAQAGLKRVDRRDSQGFSLSLWMGSTAPDGCPECLGKA
jgi:hypothetical protein